MNNLRQTIAFVLSAHEGQKDKGGEPYYFHPLAVMSLLEKPTRYERMAALLHDVVEDTDITLSDISELYPIIVTDAVDALTRREGEVYRLYIERLAKNPIARKVKLADLEHNMRPDRSFTPDGPFPRYVKAQQYLKGMKDEKNISRSLG